MSYNRRGRRGYGGGGGGYGGGGGRPHQSRNYNGARDHKFHMMDKDWDDDNTLPLGIRMSGGEKLHSYGMRGQGLRIGVLDSGVDKDHTLFEGKVIKQRWYRYGEELKDAPHGTHVAGTIHMFAPEAEIIDYRVFGKEGDEGVNEGIAAAIVQAYLDGCQILNLSLGTETPDVGILDACAYVHSHGVILVCAAGNEGDDNPMTNEFCYPSPYEETIAIAALAKKNGLPHAYFSDTNPMIDFSCIGWKIQSFKAGSVDQYCEMSGTSMACPHASGFIACLLSEGSEFRERVLGKKSGKALLELKKILTTQFCIDVGAKGFDNETGLGFITYLPIEEFNQHFYKEHFQLKDLSREDSGGSRRRPRRRRR